MKRYFSVTIINPDGSTTLQHFPCSIWEVSCLLVPATENSGSLVEFKTYLGTGEQVLERFYIKSFLITEQK